MRAINGSLTIIWVCINLIRIILLSNIKSAYEKKTSTYNTNSMKMDVSGNIWIASMYGFEKYNPGKNEFSLLPTIMTKKMSENLKQKIY